MTLREIVELTRQIVIHESEEVLSAWLYFVMRSALVKEAVARATPPTREEMLRLTEHSQIAREIIEMQDESTIEKKIVELDEKDPELGKHLRSFYRSYLDVVNVLAQRKYKREPRMQQEIKPIVE